MLDTSKIKKEIKRLRHNGDISEYGEFSLEHEVKMLENQNVINWIEYSINNPISFPNKYGSYFVFRKDGKMHQENWNGLTWAYNETSITHWAKITTPKN